MVPSRRAGKRARKPCYQCGSIDHWAKDCPVAASRDRPAKIPPPVDRGRFAAVSTAATSSTAQTATASFTFVELFAGMGGFRVALDKLGGRCVFASEIDRFCVNNYTVNFGGDRPAGDIHRIESEWIPDHDVLVGGFPCQAFSSSGKREGTNDPSGRLFEQIARILRGKRPKAFLLENVRGLYLHNNGATFRLIRKELEDCGYRVHWELLNAVNLLPQERRRLFIVGIRHDIDVKGKNYEFPTLPDLHRGVKDILHSRGTISKEAMETLALSDHQISKVRSQTYTRQHPEARFLSDLSAAAKTLQSSYTKYMVGSQFVPVKAPEEKTDLQPSPDDNGLCWRRFSSREAARLQGFPETFQLCPQRSYHMIGNAVAPPVIAMIAAPLIQLIGIASNQDVKWGWNVTKEMLLEAAPNDGRRKYLIERLEKFK